MTSWKVFYERYRAKRTSPSQFFELLGQNLNAPSQLGPRSVDGIFDKGDFAQKCVWEPRNLRKMFIRKSSPSLDPFGIPLKESMIESSTSWLCKYPNGGLTRGNMVYSKLDEKPLAFDKQSFLAMGSLRSYPLQQLRKLCCVLRQDLLPWSEPQVQETIRYLLYQVGELTNEDTPKLMWRKDLEQNELLETMSSALEALATKLEETPRRHYDLAALIEVVMFWVQFYEGPQDVVVKFVQTIRKWIIEIQRQQNALTVGQVKELSELRVRECIFHGYVIMCYGYGHLDEESTFSLGEALVLFKNTQAYFDLDSRCNTELEIMKMQVQDIMTRRIQEFDRLIMSNDLTHLLQYVYNRAPPYLKWNAFLPQNKVELYHYCCYEATDQESSTHFTVDLLSGTVLIDGAPPGRLPMEIAQHHRYKSLFGDKNFEVCKVESYYRTSQAFRGCHYDFAVNKGDLIVLEVINGKSTLELCSLEYLKQMKEVLPIRFMNLHQIWYWVENDVVLFRGLSAFDRHLGAVMKFFGNGKAICYQIPLRDQNLEYDEIMKRLKSYDYVVNCNSRLIDIMSKLEPSQYIHCFYNSRRKNEMKIELPRLRRSFMLDKEGLVHSCEDHGYILSQQQQFKGMLPLFNNYLVMDLNDMDEVSHGKKKMLIPVGNVVKNNKDGYFDIDISTDYNAHVNVAVIEQHRRLKIWTAESISNRLLLAALYASHVSLIPEPMLGMRAREAAIDAVRRSWKNSPLTFEEYSRLINVWKLSYGEPALRILCRELMRQSHAVPCLFKTSHVEEREVAKMILSQDRVEYMSMCSLSTKPNQLRRLLTDEEEERFIGDMRHETQVIQSYVDVSNEVLNTSSALQKWQAKWEHKLSSSLTYKDMKTSNFPLKSHVQSKIGSEMVQDLQESWNVFHSHGAPTLDMKVSVLHSLVIFLLTEVEQKLKQTADCLQNAIEHGRSDVRSQLLLMANYLPTLNFVDLLSSCLDPHSILPKISPNLSSAARTQIHKLIIAVLELCVFEDKLRRIERSCRLSDQSQSSLVKVFDDVQSVRKWRSQEHPRWLVFEVESQLQIREEQFLIAKHLIKNPGTVCQLNMGRGKTRVILPMLFLYYSDPKRQKTIQSNAIRAHFMRSLLPETLTFMHRNLTATTLGLHIYEQPFDRTKEFSETDLRLMLEQLGTAQRFGGVLITSPEFRLSLELKRLEIIQSSDENNDKNILGVINYLMSSLLESDNYVNVFDECDELLHHKYHLVYAVGNPHPLDHTRIRWEIAEALLQIICKAVLKPNKSKVGQFLQREPNFSCMDGDYSNRMGGFVAIRFKYQGNCKAELSKQLNRSVVEDLLTDPPEEMRWMQVLSDNSEQAKNWLIDIMSSPNATNSESESSSDLFESNEKPINVILDANQKNQVLAVRGLVAFGILQHCLERRHRVTYGIPAIGTRKKRMAIPFVAADIQSERAEFSHPDVDIVLTLLGYYHIGLTRNQVIEAFQKLLSLDDSKQKHYYSQWLQSCCKQSSSLDSVSKIDSESKIDLSNGLQVNLLFEIYRYSVQVINFFLSHCVFPTDTKQYPSHIGRSAWHLADGSLVIGFSGTNDTHRLLPLSIRQSEPEHAILRGTNGKMIHHLLTSSLGYMELALEQETKWEKTLQFAIKQKTHALVDTGALLAGVTMEDAAKYVANLDGFLFDGVTYFDSRREFNCWVVYDKTRQQVAPLLRNSGIMEKDTFVIFDEGRSRGADMRLVPDAVAVVTLGTGITKDKLMQGAGRMRQLGCNQKLWLVAFEEVHRSVVELKGDVTSPVKVLHVLEWVMENTKSAAVGGLTEWAKSGLHFSAVKEGDNLELELVEDDWKLSSLYGEAQRPLSIAKFIQQKASHYFDDSLEGFAAKICGHGQLYGLDDQVLVTSHNEECERELQVEEEEQRNVEIAYPTFEPYEELLWDYEKVLQLPSASEVATAVPISLLGEKISSDKNVAAIPWHKRELYVTSNFLPTVHLTAFSPVKTYLDFLRMVDGVLIFQDGSLLLLSDYEAELILELLLRTKAPQVAFANLSCIVDTAWDKGQKEHMPRMWLGSNNRSICQDDVALATLQLFNGQTQFDLSNTRVKIAFAELLEPTLSQKGAEEMARARGNLHKWKKSAVEKLAWELAYKKLVASA